DLSELSLYVGNHHVLDLELGNGMGRINVPRGGCSLRYSQCAHIGFILSASFRCVITIIVATYIGIQKNQPADPLAACRSSVSARNRFLPRWPSCLRC